MQYSTTRLYQFMLRMGVTFGMVGCIGVIPTVVNAQDNWTLSLKNAYIDRDYDGMLSRTPVAGRKALLYFINLTITKHPSMDLKLVWMVQCNMRFV